MKILQSTFLTVVVGLTVTATTASASATFAQSTQTTGVNQFVETNSSGTVSVTASGQTFFSYLVGGTPFATPVLADFSLSATSTSSGACGSIGCPNGDSFTEQGYTGSFSYTVSGGVHSGQNLLSGFFNVNATPTNSGGKFSSTIGGSGASFNATQSALNVNGIVLSSDFLNFTGVTEENGSWALSSFTPSFAVNPTGTTASLPLSSQAFNASGVGTFSSLVAPTSSGTPEPGTWLLMGSALIVVGTFRRGLCARKARPIRLF